MGRTKTLRTTALATLAVAALALVSAPVDASSGDEPKPIAERAGIDARGDAYMGWRHTPAPPLTDDRALRQTGDISTQGSDVTGIDVASYQGDVDWGSWKSKGTSFAYVKATESTSYTNPYFTSQYNGSYGAGLIRGAYHFATPDTSSGATQAQYFVDHGGGWSGDGKTLPGVLDIEYNPYGDTCFGMTAGQLTSWVQDFSDTYRDLTGRDVVIYTARNWWVPCMGDTSAFSQTNPLWAADYQNDPPVLFGGWGFHTFHQWTSDPLDQDYFNGAYDRLVALATG
ncbi:GH25 family lysozyme [Solicola gregarius]|uniref:Lysozyme n=1 Tax=Solicola gregarius TaxID=2908642 RepID=A0AA46TLY6_9ACTN|nr:GH25 family lysozyme [Solicola gregarius]UYM07726.1 lysozyme [Solicola gregarius]